MEKIRVFLNPHASHSGHRRWKDLIKTQLFRSAIDFVEPKNIRELNEAIDHAILDGIDVIISVGGDGTFHTLIQRLASQPCRFLVLPAGTANDLATELGFKRSIHEALETVRRNAWKPIDLITVNGRYMATNGGIGLVTDVAGSINDLRKSIPGYKSMMSGMQHQIYSLMVGVQLLTNRQRNLRLRIDSPEFSGEIESPLLMVNNQPTVAGNFLIAPETRNDDGRFNVTILTHKHLCELMGAIYRVRSRVSPRHDPQIISFETDRLTIERIDGLNKSLSFMGDGEVLGNCSRLEIGIKPRSLRVFSPSALPKQSGELASRHGQPNVLNV